MESVAAADDGDAEENDDKDGFARECRRLRGSFGGRNFKGVW